MGTWIGSRKRALWLLLSWATIVPTVASFPLFGKSEVDASPCPARWTLFRNGQATDGTQALLPSEARGWSEPTLAAWAAAQVGGVYQDDDGTADDESSPCVGCTLYDSTGGRVAHCSKGGAEAEAEVEVWVVAPGRWFMFPPGELGRTVVVKRVPPPRGPEHPIILETISATPRVFHLHNFVSEAEAEALVAFSQANTDPLYGLHRSTTGVEHEVSYNERRTSENAFDTSSKTAMEVKRRALGLLGMDAQGYEERLTDGLQVLRYNVSTSYNTHMDYLDDNGGGHDYDSSRAGSNRFATIIFYLSDVGMGGETVFPRGAPVEDGQVDRIDGVHPRPSEMVQDVGKAGDLTNGLFKAGTWQANLVRECRTRLAIRPKKAHAALFYSQGPFGSVERESLHAGCPVLNGTKWAANLWVWNKIRMGYAEAPRKPGARPFDSGAKSGRDRLLGTEGGGKQIDNETQRRARFTNKEVPGTLGLWWEETRLADFGARADLSFNTFKGHRWSVRRDGGAKESGAKESGVAEGEVVVRWEIGEDLEVQHFNLDAALV